MCDPSLTRAIPERLTGELLMTKRYTNRHFTLTKLILPVRPPNRAARLGASYSEKHSTNYSNILLDAHRQTVESGTVSLSSDCWPIAGFDTSVGKW